MYYEDNQYAFFESAIEVSVPGDCSLSYALVHSQLREEMPSISVQHRNMGNASIIMKLASNYLQ
jgi:hypothetical protein